MKFNFEFSLKEFSISAEIDYWVNNWKLKNNIYSMILEIVGLDANS